MDHLVNYLSWFLSVPYQVEGKFQAAWNQFSAAISINSGRWDANKLVCNTGLVVFVFFYNLNVWNDMLFCLYIFCKGNGRVAQGAKFEIFGIPGSDLPLRHSTESVFR